MGLTISLLLTAAGFLVQKIDPTQIYSKHPDCLVEWNELKEKGYLAAINRLNKRTAFISFNFWPQFFKDKPYLLPLYGIRDWFTYRKKYTWVTLGVIIPYLFSYFLLANLFWLTIAPWYIVSLAFMFPMGTVIASMHTFLQAHVLTMLFTRLLFTQKDLVTISLRTKNFTNIKTISPKNYYVPSWTKYFWGYYLPKTVLKYGIMALLFLGQVSLSFIPVIGPFLFEMTLSPYISRIYFTRVLKLNGINNLERNEMFYTHLGVYTSFGLTAGLLEFIPILGSFFVTTNIIATTIWMIDNYDNTTVITE